MPVTFALIPAAGKSQRMGCPKLALPLGGRTVLEHVVGALRRAGIEQVLVVVGPHVAGLAAPAEAAGAHVLALVEETPDMRATVERGLRWFEEQFRPAAEDQWLLVPADHPALDAGVVRQLVECRTAFPEASLFVPTFRGRRGHPVLIGWKHVAAIREAAPGEGLNAYLRRHAAETVELPVAAESVLWDLDTPEDYQRYRRTWDPSR